MIDVAEWIARLDAQVAQAEIGGSQAAAADFGAQQVPNGACYVTHMSEDAEPNTMTTGLHQELTATVTVWTAVHNFAEDPQDPVSDDYLQTLRAAVKAALLGWQPTGCSPVEYAGGSRVSGIEMGLLLWEDSFTTRFPLSAGC